MKILLLGEYSNLHATLADGLRQLGHQVLVVSDGTYIYNYARDISLYRKNGSKKEAIKYVFQLLRILPKLKGFDVVQLINPDFISLKAERQFGIYDYLRKHNGKIVLGAFGNDWQWVKSSLYDRIFRYGDFNVGNQLRTTPYSLQVIKEWYDTPKGRLSQYIAEDCDAIISCLYEYQVSYERAYPNKTTFIPLPIKPKPNVQVRERIEGSPIKFFLGIKRILMEYKGTDIFYQALKRIKHDYPNNCEITIVEDLPFEQYRQKMEGNDVILDQAYSYTPAMNALEAMSMGLVCIGGGEEENYEIIGEKELRPIINILPNEDSVYRALQQLILHPEDLPKLQRESIEYVKRHHDYINVAKEYEKKYLAIL